MSDSDEVLKLREALTWAARFIQCNLPNRCGDYPDFHNAWALAMQQPVEHGPLWHALARAELAEAEVERLRDRLATHNGYDRRGPGTPPDGRGFTCRCEWSSESHGDRCSEHGASGIPIPDPVAVLEAEAARLREENARLRAVFARAAETYPTATIMPSPLREWWRTVYEEFVGASQEASQ